MGRRLWDPTTGGQVGQPLAGHTGPVRALASAPAPDGRVLLASAGEDGTVRLWDPTTGGRLGQPLAGHAGRVWALAAVPGPDGRTLLASAAGNEVLVRPLLMRHRPLFLGAGDGASRRDLLGRGHLVDVLVDLLSGGAAVTVEPPSVVAVEGRWGAGKSSVLLQVQERLARADRAASREDQRDFGRLRLSAGAAARMLSAGQRPAENASEDTPAAESAKTGTPGDVGPGQSSPVSRRRVVATFNPWAHQTADQVWAGLARSVIDAAGRALYGPDDAARERYWFTRNLLRVDRRELHRLLWRRMRSPLLAIATVALLLPLAVQLATRDSRVTVFGERIPSGLLAAAFPALLLVAGLLHTAGRYFFARASSFLPGMLFTGPVLSGALAQTDTAREPALQDPLYRSRSGYLYLVQHDVRALLDDLDAAGGELVMFVDDLDRCTPATTAQVLEAINLFLSEEFPRARFVIGLDPEVVAAHIDRTYSDLLATPGIALPGDRTPGWTFLRKLIQLPVMLPAIPDDGIDRLLDDVLQPATPARTPPPGPTAPPASPVDPPTPPDQDLRQPQAEPDPPSTQLNPPAATPQDADPTAATTQTGSPRTGTPTTSPAATPEDAGPPTPTRTAAAPTPAATAAPIAVPTRSAASEAAIQATLERHPEVRRLLRERLLAQPERSARDTKRLLTLWQFYARLLEKADPLDDDGQLVDRALDLVIVAELITRWPAHQTAFRRHHPARTTTAFAVGDPPPERGLDLLAAATEDDVAWSRAEAAVLACPVDGLRHILHTYDGPDVAALYGRLT